MSEITMQEYQNLRRVNALRRSRIPEKWMNGFACWDGSSTPEARALHTSAFDWVESYDMGNPSQRGLLLIGPTGIGKSHLAACIGVMLINTRAMAGEKVPSVLWCNVASLFMRIRSTFGRNAEEAEDDLIEELVEPNVLILDDLGVERPSAWVMERLYLVLNLRLESSGKTIIVTSNYSGRQLIERMAIPDAADMAERVVSRLAGMADPIGAKFPTADFRKRRAKEAVQA